MSIEIHTRWNCIRVGIAGNRELMTIARAYSTGMFTQFTADVLRWVKLMGF